MSRTDIVDEAKAQASLELLREINSKAAIITTPIEKLEGKKLLEVMEHPVSLADELLKEEHEHHHHHDHDDECGCGCHDHHHDHEGHHHADDVFTSWGLENVGVMKKEDLQKILDDLAYGDKYGEVLRAKGMVPSEEKGVWLHFDMVPEQAEIREGAPDFTGKVCVIGAELDEEGLKAAFNA